MEQARTNAYPDPAPSFTALVRERFLSELSSAVRQYEQDGNRKPIRSVLSKVIVTDVSEDRVYFHALFHCFPSGKLLISDASCSAADDFRSVEIRGILPVYDGYRPKAVLPDSLIPSFSKRELDLIARRLAARLYPKALEYAVPVGSDAAARRLGLKVIEQDLGPRDGFLGKIFFEDGTVSLSAGDETRVVPVSRGTMLVNVSPDGFYDQRIRAATILHECVHWILHRPAYALLRTCSKQYASAICRKRSAATCERTAPDRMERQADALASRLLLPEWSARFVAETWFRRYARLPRLLRTERVIDRMSRHFRVSRRMAKIRMIELGYPDAEDAFSCCERRTQQIPFENAVWELGRDPAFAASLASGVYAYVESCFVVLDRKNVFRGEDGILYLTPYAKAHMEECCLSFVSRRRRRDSAGGMLRQHAKEETFLPGSELDPEAFMRCTKHVTAVLQNLPPSFSETLAAHMSRTGITNEQLAERCLLSDRQIYRFKSELFPRITLKSAVALCIGLRLHPILATDLITKAGYRFNASLEHTAYRMLILTMTNRSIYECNEQLKKTGVKPIGTEEDV